MTGREKSAKINTQDGWVRCPICGNNRLKKVQPDESAELVRIHCRRCKNDIAIRIDKGQCFESRGR